jgi:large subunit ribosomal protein L13
LYLKGINLKLVIQVDTLSYKTVSANSATVTKEWVVVDAEGLVLGRMASKVALVLRGKHKPSYTPHVDCGDNVIVINAEKVILTGKKLTDKEYIRHSGYPGGQITQTAADILKKYPERLVEKAIKGMLPKNRLGAELFRNLRVVVGPNHDHEAQKPRVIDLNSIR